jgi:hypothetical protein
MNWQPYWLINKKSNNLLLCILLCFEISYCFSRKYSSIIDYAALFFREPLITNCPVCGEDLGKYDNINDMIHMTLCFDEGTGNQIMTGGFLTDKQASYG